MTGPHEESDAMPHQGEAAATPYIFGNYEILDVIGRRALDRALDRVVALKVLRTGLYMHPRLLRRFQREARAIAQLNHPNIVETYSTGSVGKVPYIAMEYIEGPPLSRVIKQEHLLHWERSLRIAEQVAEALACAHGAQIIHRDIKPPNILIAEGDHVYVTDFGLAKLLTAQTQLTVDGTQLGTPQYMSPEQCRAGEVTVASDLYSLGVVLFIMISGRLPYRITDKAHLISTIIAGRPARLRDYVPEAPEEVEKLVAYLLEKDPENRPPNATAVCEAIARVREGKPLDTSEGGMTTALADFRHDAIETATPASPTPTSSQSSSLDRAMGINSWLRTCWQALPPMVRRVIIVGAVALVGAGFGSKTASVFYPDPGIDIIPSAPDTGSRWKQSAAVAVFVKDSPGVLLSQFNLPDFAVTNAQWTGTGSYAVAQINGIAGTPREGQRAICLASPSLRRAILALPPLGPLAGSNDMVPVALAGAARNAPAGSPLLDRFLLRCETLGSAKGIRRQAIIACHPAKGAPLTVFEVPTAKPDDASSGFSPRAVSAVDLKPGAEKVAAAVSTDDDSTSWSLVEDTVAFYRPTKDYVRLTREGSPISAVQYSPDGSHIAYLRHLEAARKQLWIVKSDGSERNGRLLVEGNVILGPQAFSPDGQQLVLAERFDSGESWLRVIRTSDGHIETELAEGGIAAWHPSGAFIVATAPDSSGHAQLWAIVPQNTQSKVQLTHLYDGAVDFCSISSDGTWAVSIPTGVQKPTISFANLAGVPL